MADSHDELPEINADEAIELVAGGAILIDVREQGEWDAGHAPGAQLLPMSVIRGRLDELPADRQLLVICELGGRSLRVTSLLRQAGYDAVNVAGGMSTWVAVGGPIEQPAS
ncbi:MAG: rhodanese-like domain-containing protein [Rhodoglobus sp.]